MADLSNEFMDGPIPGESLTKELGGEPHERPPMYTDPEEVYDFLVEKITSDKVMEKISVSVQLGVPAELVVRAITFVGWAEGYYSIDNMMLVLGPITELTFAILDKSGIDYEKLSKFIKLSIDIIEEQREAGTSQTYRGNFRSCT